MDLSFHGLVTFIVASALVDIYIYICEDVNSTDVRTVDISCKAYNFRFFKTSCVTQRHVLRVLSTIVPWILPIAGKSFKFITRNHSNV